MEKLQRRKESAKLCKACKDSPRAESCATARAATAAQPGPAACKGHQVCLLLATHPQQMRPLQLPLHRARARAAHHSTSPAQEESPSLLPAAHFQPQFINTPGCDGTCRALPSRARAPTETQTKRLGVPPKGFDSCTCARHETRERKETVAGRHNLCDKTISITVCCPLNPLPDVTF